MDEKRKVRGNFRIYLQWPIFLSVLMVLLTAAVGAVSLRAGIIVSFFTLIYIGIALWLYFSRRKGILGGLIAFSQAYDQSKSKFALLCGGYNRPHFVDEPGNGSYSWG